MGVITAFSVAKKITEEDIHKFFNRSKKRGKSEVEIEKMLKKKIVDDIQEAIVEHKIPGLISPEDIARQMGLCETIVANLPELNRLIVVITHKLLEKKYDKMSLCYMINSLVNLLGLSEGDFEKFHRQNSNDDDDGEDYKDA